MATYKEQITEENNSMFNVHDNLKELSVPELQKRCREDQRAFSVGIINITGGLNVGGIIRSASLFGASRVVIFGRKTFDARSAVGAKNYIDIKHYKEVTMAKIEAVSADYNMRPVFIEQGGIPLDIFEWKAFHTTSENKWLHPFIILGNENTGIPDYILSENIRYTIISVPQVGVLRSFNVASAASIVMYDLCNKVYCQPLLEKF